MAVVSSKPCLFSVLAAGLVLFLFAGSHVDRLSPQIKKTQTSSSSGSTLTSARNYNHILRDGRGIRILHLIDRLTEEAVMDRWFTRSQASFAAQYDIIDDAIMWGAGFEGYDTSKSLLDNLVTRFGSATYFDAILPYYNQDQAHHLSWDPAPYFLEVREVSAFGVVIIDRPHEMRDGRRIPILDLANVSLLLAPYPNELFEHKQYMDKALLVHQPHPINPDLFMHPVDGIRPHDIYLAGSLEAGLYPLRARLGEMIREGILPDASIRQHPGYPDIMPPEERKHLGIDGAFLENQLADYSKAFGQSKICIVTASRWQYAVQKYHEAATAGCLIVGTLPADRRDAFAKFVVPISMDQTDAEIVAVFKRWLDDESGRQERATIGQEWVVEKFSDRRYVEDVAGWIRAVQRGQRGMVLPWEWTPLPDPLEWDG